MLGNQQAVGRKKANVGDQIQFFRRGILMSGMVYVVRDNSVCVEISRYDATRSDLENNTTVVAHGKGKRGKGEKETSSHE
jgi:uncharacterized protein YkvS